MKFPLMKNNITKDDLDKVISYLKTKDPILTSSSKVLEFEKKWSKWLKVKYSVFVNSGSSANLLSMALLKIRHPNGGEVIVSPLNWVSDITSIIQNGFKPIFVDINPDTLSMDNKKIIGKLNKKTKAVFLSHIQGFNGLSNILIKELKKRRIPLIEDVCESHGSMHNKKKLGSFGLISNFSFYYAHHISTIEGGMICTNNKLLYQQARILRAHGMLREATDKKFINKIINSNKQLNPKFIFLYPGFNLRNTEIGAIIGINQLKRLNNNILKRNKNFSYFLKNIDPKHYKTQFKMEGCSNYAFPVILKRASYKKRDLLEKLLTKSKIEFRRGNAGGGNLQPDQPD